MSVDTTDDYKKIDIEQAEDAEVLENLRSVALSYGNTENGGTIDGTTFSIDFVDSIDPKEFAEMIATANDPWNAFGISTAIAPDYQKFVGTLLDPNNPKSNPTKITLEIAPDWIRVYQYESGNQQVVLDFLKAVYEKHEFMAHFPKNQSEN